MISKIIRLINTIKYLKPLQGFYFFWRRIIGLRRIDSPKESPDHRNINFDHSCQDNNSLNAAKHSFTFLNTEKIFDGPIDWQAGDQNRLWRYNLHYFDYLKSKKVNDNYKASLISSWIKDNPQGSEPAWEPYTASLRIVNWIKFFSAYNEPLNEAWVLSLYEQCLWLEKNLELHILANHYFENLRAVLFASAFFEGEEATRWQNLAIREINKQLNEQFLSDGGHYERTPQYHVIMMEVCLDMLNLLNNNKQLQNNNLINELTPIVTRGVNFLTDIVGPANQIPLFNDSAYGVAPEIEEICHYAKILGCNLSSTQSPLIVKEPSGIYAYKSNRDWFVIDCGDIGPSYQPGHTHCDFLSYELFLDGFPVIVDTGVLEYEPGQIRQYLRSTAAHNTISVAGSEQSEVWGEFRVARRAKKRFATVNSQPDEWTFNGAFQGFHAIGGAVHQRTVKLEIDAEQQINRITVSDEVNETSARQITSYIHFHPNVDVAEQENAYTLSVADGPQIQLELKTSSVKAQLIQTDYYPHFGVAKRRMTLQMDVNDADELKIQYSLRRIL